MANSNFHTSLSGRELLQHLDMVIEGDPYWEDYLRHIYHVDSSVGIHLAIFIEPYLQFILEGRKTVESRFSVHRVAPYQRVQKGDVLLLKKSGGPIVGLCEVSDVWFYNLDPKSWSEIKTEFTRALCVQDPTFWSQRRHALFATLMRIKHTRAIEPIEISKHDRRGWVVLRDRKDQTTIYEHSEF